MEIPWEEEVVSSCLVHGLFLRITHEPEVTGFLLDAKPGYSRALS